MSKQYLTKQDFQRWMTCPTAAFHGWGGMKSKNENDSFLEFLSEEGTIIGKAAHRLFQGAELIGEMNLRRADSLTRNKLKKDTATLFEACIIYEDFVVRPDVLVKRGNRMYLIEAKSKVGDMHAHRKGNLLINCYGDVRAAWREVVHDIAFQVEVLSRVFPDYLIVPYLMLPEESSVAGSDEIDAIRTDDFSSPSDYDELQARRAESVLKFFPAQAAINKTKQLTTVSMDAMRTTWQSRLRPKPKLRYQCRNCQFRLSNGKDPSDGFHACWGALADPDPSIYELNQLYSLKVGEKGQSLLADAKINSGQTSLYDIQESELHGEHSLRQRMQLKFQREGTEWVDPTLVDEISSLSWPVAFVDFETTMAGIPWYSGLKPFEVLPFEFSCHILHRDGRMEHVHWLNQEDQIPTLPFVRALKSALEVAQSILVYTDYEVRVLKDALGLLARLGESTEEQEWISGLLNSGRIVDQHDWVHKYYFHPMMGGRTSIKKVLPAIWKSNPVLHQHHNFRRYYLEKDGMILDPYESLPAEHIHGVTYSVKEGCGAMAAYREMIRGAGAKDRKVRRALSAMLERYVTLDTASQWMLFEHWRQRLDLL